MAKYKIAWMPGDGVGNDVMDAAKIVLDALNFDAEYVPADIGWEFWCKEGNPLPDRTIEISQEYGLCPVRRDHLQAARRGQRRTRPRAPGQGAQLLQPHRQASPALQPAHKPSPVQGLPRQPAELLGDDIDLVVFRENTEGMYGGIEWFPLPEKVAKAMADEEVGHPARMKRWFDKGLENVAVSTRVMSKQGCESICRQAFEYAKAHNRKSVTLCEKPNVLRETGGLMTRVFRDVAKDYPGVEPWEANIDAICMWMIKNPQDYAVLVAENMFGDIVSDLCAGLIGGLGFACAANIGDDYAVFEPTHGSAPKYDGKFVVNPMAMLLTVKLMFDWLKEDELAQRLEVRDRQSYRGGQDRDI